MVLDRDLLIITPHGTPTTIKVSIPEPGKYEIGEKHIINLSKAAYPDAWPNDPNIIYIHPDKIEFPLVVRNWQPGDRISPLGMDGKHQKIQDILTDAKLSRIEKEEVLVLVQKNEIIWAIGHKMSDKWKLDTGSEALRVELGSR